MTALHDLTVAALADQLRAKKVSATELAQHFLARSQADTSGAFLSLNPDATLAQAKEADAQLAAGNAGPLAGVPMAHKDIFVTTDFPTTAGSKMLEGYRSPFDATVVRKLGVYPGGAGMVNVGKLNCDEFAMGSSNENSAYKSVTNPWDTTRGPGGSSGGSSAAVAARLVPAATGTDTGGSVRQPAALCGVSGIKPTYGAVSRYGMIAYGSSLDQAGPLAANAADLVELLDTMSGFDPRDATSAEQCHGAANAPGRIRGAYQSTNAHYAAQGAQPLKGLRIGVPREYFGDGLNNEVAQAVDAAIAQFEALGATRVDISLPRTQLSIPAYYVIAPAEASSNLSRYDGVRYGHRSESYTDLADMTARSRAEGFGSEVKRRILVGSYVLSHGYYDAYYLKAQKVRRLVTNDFAHAFEQCDLILGPVAPTAAFNLGEKNDDPVQMYLSDIYTLSANLAGLPAMSVPAGFAANGRPIGLQIIGNYFDEARMLNVAHQFQQVSDFHKQAPKI
jgi:aspartyl-tRNA(Asn)/glutamyl-tRNA(Gln) amidotransferase subunit A